MEITDAEPPGKTTQILTEEHLPLHHYIPKTRANHFFYKNGLSKLIPRLTVKVHSNLDECGALWEQFSPKKSLFDLWDFRMAWYGGYRYQPFFYTVYERNKPLAVLPLWYAAHKNQYQWFGSDWMEDNTFFVEDEKLVDVLFQIAPTPLHLNCVVMNSDWSNRNIYPQLKEDEPKNLKSLADVSSMDELLHTFDKKDRYNLRSDYNKILEMNPKIVITEGKNMNKLNMMIEMNIERFSKDPADESDLVESDRRATYEHMVTDAVNYKVKFIEVYIQNHLAAIDFICEYNNVYYTMKGGNDINRFDGIGNFMVYTEFEDALNSGSTMVDCLQIDNGWKHRFFDQKELFILEK